MGLQSRGELVVFETVAVRDCCVCLDSLEPSTAWAGNSSWDVVDCAGPEDVQKINNMDIEVVLVLRF